MAEDGWGGIQREDQIANELRVWEAGLATAAAPLYFKAFFKPETKKSYLDGGLKANFPGEKALEEMSSIWTVKTKLEVIHPHLDLMVTVGTGLQHQEVHIPFAGGGFNKMVKIFSENIDSDRMWQDFRKKQSQKRASRTVRLNSSLPTTKYISFYDYKMMDAIADHVSAEGKSNPDLRESITSVAGLLLASLFFFQPDDMTEPISRIGQSTAACSGSIRCRLAKGSVALEKLMNKVKSFWLKTTTKGEDDDLMYVLCSKRETLNLRTSHLTAERRYDSNMDPIVKEVGSTDTESWNRNWKQVPFTRERRRMSQAWNGDGPFRLNIKLTAANPGDFRYQRHHVAVSFGDFEAVGPIPISGFPATLDELQGRCKAI